MGQIMIIALGATAFLCLRKMEGTVYRFATSAGDWKTGITQFVFFVMIGGPVVILTGFAHFGLLRVQPWAYPIAAVGIFIGMYAVVALFEELFFRGILQNLATASMGSAVAAQVLASLLFGIVHLPFRGFPNWKAVAVNVILGWFCGQAYRERRSVAASGITHALATTAWRVFLAG
jgi:membrane protease YdiL (CAAX protease family)